MMKLRFLGQNYYASNTCIETIPSEHTARFLGKSYIPSLPLTNINTQLGLKKKYRGVPYNV